MNSPFSLSMSHKSCRDQAIHKSPLSERTARFNHPLTSYSDMVRNMHSQPQKLMLTRFLRGVEVRAFRKTHRLSANELAKHLLKDADKGTSFSRAYVKRVESGGLRASPRFVHAFDELKATFTGTPIVEPQPLTLVVHYAMPEDVQELEILSKPRRCLGCRKWFVPVTPNQRIHNSDSCRRAAR